MARKNKELSADSLPLVAIDLGSDGVRAMAAKKVGDDLFHILGVEQSHKYPSIEKGVVTQTSNAGYMISEVLRLLANRIKIENLPTAFVSVGGKSMHIVHVMSKRDQIHAHPVSQQLLQAMERECKNKLETKHPELVVLGLIPAYFVLDGVEQEQSPADDQPAVMVEAHYIAFYARKEVKQQLQKSFDQAGRSIEQSFVRPEALLQAFVLNDGAQVLQDGCAVLDFGAQTTTLTIFKHTTYLFNQVVPLGGYNITRAIAQEGVSDATAEQLKCQFGFAAPAMVERNLTISVGSDPTKKKTFTSASLAGIIEQKLEEILAPLLPELAKFENRLETLYITGGGSMLGGLVEYLQQRTALRVTYGAHAGVLDSTTHPDFCKPVYSSLVGTIILGSDYRSEHKGAPVRKPNLLERIKATTIVFFSDEENVYNNESTENIQQ
ncbi:MAG: rod shape-determining protein [Paludibacteraceae bacterium]|nr:rod shape-determining protein [Paludibacteraceae bacterium]